VEDKCLFPTRSSKSHRYKPPTNHTVGLNSKTLLLELEEAVKYEVKKRKVYDLKSSTRKKTITGDLQEQKIKRITYLMYFCLFRSRDYRATQLPPLGFKVNSCAAFLLYNGCDCPVGGRWRNWCIRFCLALLAHLARLCLLALCLFCCARVLAVSSSLSFFIFYHNPLCFHNAPLFAVPKLKWTKFACLFGTILAT